MRLKCNRSRPRSIDAIRHGAILLLAFNASAGAVEFAGTGNGAIPDGHGGSGGDAVCDATTLGPPLVVEFDVRNLADVVRSVGVRVTFAPAHTWVGDLHLRLAAPGGSPAAPLFGDTGAGAAGDDGSDAQGAYAFGDEGSSDWWSTASETKDEIAIAAGYYRATADGTGEPVSFDAAFAGLAPQQANGTWTLTIADDCAQDTGGVAAASLVINATLPVELQAFVVD